ncbi:MAG: secretin N-terminal domain-containing protein [Verrucomicrobiota bacterium]
MKPLQNKTAKPACSIALGLALLLAGWPAGVSAQIRFSPSGGGPMGMPSGMPPMNSDSPSRSDSSGEKSGTWIPSEPLASAMTSTNLDGSKTNAPDEIQLSFQGANIDMVVQWLAQTTGKSVVKHPQVQCQLTISSSKKLTTREAINLVYRALALEGFTAIEFGKSILIMPESKEPKMSPELLDASQTTVPEGRQRLVKVFSLEHIQASDLKERIRTALSDKAIIDIDERANQLIITDYNDNIRTVSALIETLDNDKPEDVAVRVLPVKNVSAADLVKAIGPLYQKRNSKSLKDTVEISADEQSNSLLILSSESNFRAILQFVTGMDTEDAQEKTMRTFTLQNADAQDVAKQLQDLNQDQNTSSRYVYFMSQAPSGKSAKKLKVVADRRRNAVIVQAAPSDIEGIAAMIAQLDEPVVDGSLAPQIYQLKYISAADIEDVLNELFLKKTQQRNYWFSDYNDDSSTADRDVGRLYGKVRITSEPHSNTLIVTSNSKENLAVVEDVLRQLDVPSGAGESTLRIDLRFAKASSVANSINILFAKNGAPPLRPTAQSATQGGTPFQQQQQQQQGVTPQTGFDLESEAHEDGYYPWLGGQPDNVRGGTDKSATRPVSDLVGRVRAVADQRGNALLISANVHFFPQILKLVEQMDAPSDQVLIEARIVEVASDFLDKLGVRWSPDGSQVYTPDDYDNSFLLHSTAQHRQGFGGNTTVNTPSDTQLAQTLASLRSGVVDSSISMDFLVQFLKKTTEATVLGNPQINIRNNETGRLFVGQQVPIQTQSIDSGANGLRQSFSYKNVGVILEVTPHINSSGDVELKVHAESSTVVPGVTVLGGAVFDTRTFRTDLRAKDGQTLVLGGIIQKQISDTLRTTPYLGSIPGLGWAFKKKDKTTREVELMVFLRPRVVRTDEDATKLMEEINKQTPLLQKSREENKLIEGK